MVARAATLVAMARALGACFVMLVVMSCKDTSSPAVVAPVADGAPVKDAAAHALTLDPSITSMLSSTDSARIATNIKTLVAFGTRSSCSDASLTTQGIGAARDWIQTRLTALPGAQVQLFAYDQTGCATTAKRHDVIAYWPSATHPNRLVVIGGHYDSRPVSVSDGTSAAPGANDSGSQTAVVLEAANAMVGQTLDASLLFVAFAGEEQGLVGSAALAKAIGTLFPGAAVEAMLNCDIVGGDSTSNDATAQKQFRLYSPGTPRELLAGDGTTDNTSPSRGLMRFVGTWGGAYVPAMTMLPKLREDRPGRGGDHEPFIAQGYPGVRFIEPVETLAHQHSPDDLFNYVTPDYTANIARLVIAVGASLARAPSAPASFGGSGSAASPVFTWVAPASGKVDHYVLAARPVTENFYRMRVPARTTTASPSASELGIDPGVPYFVSVAAVDAAGHESLFAYPEYRCDDSACVVPAGALDVTATN